jgi:folate-binding protein YgfZ
MTGDDNWRMFDAPTAPTPSPSTSPTFDGATALGDWGVIRARGPEAAAFLNSQLTADLLNLDAGRARLAGYCSPKGRLLATFVAWRAADDEILLACSADLLAATLKRLSMFVLRAKCKLDDASVEWPLRGLAGATAEAMFGTALPRDDWSSARHGEAHAIRLPAADGHSRFLWAGTDAPPLAPLHVDAWRWLEVRSGIARVVAATADQFVPQMLNLELLGGVDFKKGCYPGQEVVARSQYRGTLKRRTYLAYSSAALTPGTEVFHSADPGQPAGLVVLAASLPESLPSLAPEGRHAALVELKIAALQGGELRAANGAGLSAAPLPYSLEPLAL